VHHEGSRKPIQNPSVEMVKFEIMMVSVWMWVDNNWCLVLVRFLENKRV